MIPLTFLYDAYIDRPKLSEEKNPFEYIVPPPTSRVGAIIAKMTQLRPVEVADATDFLYDHLGSHPLVIFDPNYMIT